MGSAKLNIGAGPMSTSVKIDLNELKGSDLIAVFLCVISATSASPR